MKLLILGASGHGKVAADTARLCAYDEILFFDDEKRGVCGDWPIVGTSDDLCRYDGELFVAIGNAQIRSELCRRFSDRKFATLIHPSAVIGGGVTLGEGSIVLAGAVLNYGAQVGRSSIVNTCASVDHDCVVGDFCHIAVGAHLCGTVTLGDHTWIGAGATVVNNLSVCANCMIGAGAVVTSPITVPGTYVGVPAKLLKKASETQIG